LLRLRYALWRRLARPAVTQYVTIHGYEAMLRSRSDDKRRAKRFAKIGIGSKDTAALGARLMEVLVSENVFGLSGCNSFAIYRLANEHLGFTGAMTESAVNGLLAAGILERTQCDVPPNVHPRETVEWWRVQPTRR
jgi:hypothetical protein